MSRQTSYNAMQLRLAEILLNFT